MLNESESPPFKVVNPNGSALLLITCDHAANQVPKNLNCLGLETKFLEQHIAYDIGAKQVAIRVSELFDAPLLLSNYSRLVVDLNRHLDDPSLIPAESDGVEIPGNQNLSDEQRNLRISNIFQPYHDNYSGMVGNLIRQHQRPIILSIHSFTPKFNGFNRPWDFGVLWDNDEMLAKDLIRNFSEYPGRVIGDNQPYHANNPRGYAQIIHARDRGVEMALLETRHDLIKDAAGQNKISDIIYTAIKPIVEASL